MRNLPSNKNNFQLFTINCYRFNFFLIIKVKINGWQFCSSVYEVKGIKRQFHYQFQKDNRFSKTETILKSNF